MATDSPDESYLRRRLATELQLAAEATDHAAAYSHSRMAHLYAEKLREIAAGEDRMENNSAAQVNAALARTKYGDSASRYAAERSAAAEQLGETERARDWRAAAEKLAQEGSPEE